MPNPRQDEPSATGFKAVDKIAEEAETAAKQTAEAVQSEARSFTDQAAAAMSAASKVGPDPEAVSQATQSVAARMREFSSEWLQAWRDQTARSLEGVARLSECRTPLDLVRLQGELARQNLSDTVSLARRLNSASLKALGAIAEDSAKAANSQQPPAR